MTDLIEVQTSDLAGAALDWAVAQVEALPALIYKSDPPYVYIDLPGRGCGPYFPSHAWFEGGPLIQKYGSDLNCIAPLNAWEANCWDDKLPTPGLHLQEGETPLIAVCRAIVRAKMGDTVQVPKELIQ